MNGSISTEHKSVRIVSWLGGEHWYIGVVQYLHLEDAIRACERRGWSYEIVEGPAFVYQREGD
jgi:hypothetical protein